MLDKDFCQWLVSSFRCVCVRVQVCVDGKRKTVRKGSKDRQAMVVCVCVSGEEDRKEFDMLLRIIIIVIIMSLFA